MNMLGLSLAYLRRRPLTTGLNLLLLALGVALIAFLLLLERGLENRLSRDVAGIDMVVGAKGSPLQLVLSAVMQVDVPTGNVPLAAVEELRRNPLVRQAIPVAMGDSYGTYRILGTEPAYIAHYGGHVVTGRMFEAPMEAVLGAEVAASSGLGLDSALVGSHGLTAGGDAHADMPYRVVGILARTGTVLDRLVLTPVSSVWAVHDHHHHEDKAPATTGEHADGKAHDHGAEAAHDHDHDHDHDHGHHHDHDHDDVAAGQADSDDREVTAILVRYATPLAAARLPREINSQTSMQAASPAAEMLRLRALMGVGLDSMRLLGLVLVLAAGLSTFVALANALQERQYDLAVMRALGAGRGRIMGQILTEAMLVALGGAVLGIALAHAGVAALSGFSARARDLGLSAGQFVAGEAWLLGLSLLVALLAAAVPAIRAYRTDVSRLLAKG
ncbi:FtsX-like permease family protein [Niveispirillum cyanobacteriorum]|uniref:Multidrug ABC transporter substrate-binding protein n=1 Tax=Niveispirillum cyanobacteriorum TaxID=1612173 RepID=A0A2K9NHZ0_9PROT|nr:FtsX-like permease family protein [Niveispirillum cyanobacteriorum]AUN32681.1 multidrug ABC transporter substrate-binding protein [Niveispirillum cyanobacteriorum]GGE83216.1 peptide ABC transporter permease [Niveispirillum cyanobacteriorum]